ncbi:MAG: hypothetical protein ACOY3N_05870 [Bradyrhizobium sp.]|uniref:hypothetical protein n=1 Tax=Bradyrhizobium sp. TaxID=376 RepID=UPI003BF0B209
MADDIHPLAPHRLPFFLPGPDGSDVLLVAMGFFLVAVIFSVGVLYWKLHSLPERMAHKSQKLQFEFVAVLGLISLFTGMHAFWIAGLLLALIDIPDFGTPLRDIAGSVEKIADAKSDATEAASLSQPSDMCPGSRSERGNIVAPRVFAEDNRPSDV